MKKLSLLVAGLVTVLFVSPSFASREEKGQLKVFQMDGDVKVCKDKECSAAQIGQVLQVGELVQTGVDGRAVLRMGKDTYELRGRSKILVDRISFRESRLNMVLGMLKAKVHFSLFGRKSVSVVTPTGVMAVRGTEFICNVSDAGDTRLDVLYGRVDFLDKLTEKVRSSFVQGESGNARAAGEGEAVTGMEKAQMEPEAFQEAFGGEKNYQDYKQADQENKNSAQRFESDETNKIAEAVQMVRENDLASGRTLRDHFGNLTRVEQRLFRPSGDQVQFVNIVKRNEYRYAGFFAPDAGTLSGGARMDFASAMVKFDRSIPENIMEWPSFFADQGDNLNVLRIDMKVANNRPSATNMNSDFMEMTVVYNPAEDRLGGTVCGGGQTLGSNCFQQLVIGYNDGTTNARYGITDCGRSGQGFQCTLAGGAAPVTTVEQKTDGSGTGDLFSTIEKPVYIYSKDIRSVATGLTIADPLVAATDNTLWLLAESYAIDNGGGLLNVNKILNSEITDPFAYLRTVAGHAVITARYGAYNPNTNTGGATLFRRGNIDLVMIPDLTVDLVQKLASQLK